MNQLRQLTILLFLLTIYFILYPLIFKTTTNVRPSSTYIYHELKQEYKLLRHKINTKLSSVDDTEKNNLEESIREEKEELVETIIESKKNDETEIDIYYKNTLSTLGTNIQLPELKAKNPFQPIKMKKDGIYENIVINNFNEKNDVKCFSGTIYPGNNKKSFQPTFHSNSLINSINSNNRKQYKLILKMGNENIQNILLDPYQLIQPQLKKEPIPSLCIFQGAFIDREGNMCKENICLQSKSCNPQYYKKNRGVAYSKIPIETAVYVISENQGYGFFHYLIENWTRLFVAFNFLKKHPEIKIHVINKQLSFVQQSFKFLGLETNRLITGDYYSGILLFPEPVGCGSPAKNLLIEARRVILSRREIFSKLHLKLEKKKQILIVKRHGGRSISNNHKLHKALKKKYGETISIKTFTKDTFENAMELFASSDLIIAPHGAGLSNIVACQPGTIIIEILLEGKLLNLCYMYMAVKLNLKYHGWSNSKIRFKNKPMKIDVRKIIRIVDENFLL